MLNLLFVLSLVVPSLAVEISDCKRAAEVLAMANEQKDFPKEKFTVKSTEKMTGLKPEEEGYTMEVHNSKGAFTPYDVIVKKDGCKAVSVQATTL